MSRNNFQYTFALVALLLMTYALTDVRTALFPSQFGGSIQSAAAVGLLGGNNCPTGYTCVLIPYVKGCPVGYMCTAKPIPSLNTSGVSCKVYIDANRIPAITSIGKPTGGSSVYTYTLWNQYGPITSVPATKVPGTWGYTQNQGGPGSYLAVTSGTTTSNVQCDYSTYSIGLTSSATSSSTPNQLGEPFIFAVKPSDTTSKSVSIKLSLTCPTGVSAPMQPNTSDACNSTVNLVRTTAGDYFSLIAIRNKTSVPQSVGITAQALNMYGEIVATDKGMITVLSGNIPLPSSSHTIN
jgi:hypothetical protein